MSQVYFDLPLAVTDPPAPSDILVGARREWPILEVRPVESKIWPNRWRLHLGPGVRLVESEGTRWLFDRYRPGEGPHEYFAED